MFAGHKRASVLCNWVSPTSEAFIQTQQEVFAIARIPPCSADGKSRTMWLSKTTLARDLSNHCWAKILSTESTNFLMSGEAPDHLFICTPKLSLGRQSPNYIYLPEVLT